jgi:hypothetical protein
MGLLVEAAVIKLTLESLRTRRVMNPLMMMMMMMAWGEDEQALLGERTEGSTKSSRY